MDSFHVIHRGIPLKLDGGVSRGDAKCRNSGNSPVIPRLLLLIPLLPRPSNRRPRPLRPLPLLRPLLRLNHRRLHSDGRGASATLRAPIRTPGSLKFRLPRLRLHPHRFPRNTQGNGSRFQPPEVFFATWRYEDRPPPPCSVLYTEA